MREQPVPSPLEERIGEGGWLVELLLPRTDAGVAAQAVVVLLAFAALLVPARRVGLLQLWGGTLVLVGGLFVLRAAH